MLAERRQAFCDGFDDIANIFDRDRGQLIENVKMVDIGIKEMTDICDRSQRIMKKMSSQTD